MEFLDRHTFEDCMRQVFSRFDRQEEMLASMQEARQEKPPLAGIMEDDTMDNQDVCMLLRVSKRTLQRYPQRRAAALPDAPPQDLLPQVGRGAVHQHPHEGDNPRQGGRQGGRTPKETKQQKKDKP